MSSNKAARTEQQNGDDKGNNLEELKKVIEQFKGFNIRVLGNYGFRMCSGETREARGWLEQFTPYEAQWSDEEALRIIEAHLEGKAKLWFAGAKRRFFNTYEEFKKEWTEKYGEPVDDPETELFRKIQKIRLRKGKLEEDLLALFAVPQETIRLEHILGAITKDLKKSDRDRLCKENNWKGLLRVAQEIDNEEVEPRERHKTNGQIGMEKNQTPQETSVKVERVIKCYECGGPHFKTNCPQRKAKNTEKKLTVMIQEQVENRPKITLYKGGMKIETLLDSGASGDYISDKIVKQTDWQVEEDDECCVRLGKGMTETTGAVRLYIEDQAGEYQTEIRPSIIADLNEDLILGVESMRKLHMEDLLNEDMITVFDGEKVKLHKKVRLKETKEINSIEVIDPELYLGESEIVNQEVRSFLRRTEKPKNGEQQDVKYQLPIKHTIKIKEGMKPIYLRPYRRSFKENEIIKEEVERMLKQGIVRESQSEFSSPVVLVRKKDGQIRFCVDYRRLNDITVVEPFPIPIMEELLESVAEATIFSALDMEAGYHQIEIASEDIGKTAFSTKDGQYEWLRMPFGLVNAPFTFQRIMNFIFKKYLWKFIVVYLDDILIFSDTQENHAKHVAIILNLIEQYGLRLNMRKCHFGVRSVDFLGFKVSEGKMTMQEAQRTMIMEIKEPRTIGELRSLLGVLTFFRKFIPGFAIKADQLFKRLQKDNFGWGKEESQTLETLKAEIVRSKGLTLPVFSKPFKVYTDASGFGVGAVLTQEQNGNECVILWISRKFTNAELNYTTTEKECLSVIWAIKKLKVYLTNHFTIFNDHSALQWLIKQKEPTGRLARWIMTLQELDFEVKHITGRENTIADALSRGLGNQKEKSEREICAIQKLQLNEAEKEELIARVHDELGHASSEVTTMFIKKQYEVEGIRKIADNYIEKCAICQEYNERKRTRNIKRIPLGEPFELIGIDITGPLPKTEKGNRFIIVATDYLTRWAEAKAIKHKTSNEIAKFIVEEIILRHGAPNRILSDQGREFTNKFVQLICAKLGVLRSFSSAYHPQCNGAVERLNRTLTAKLAKQCQGDWNNWDEKLTSALYSYRICPINKIKSSPFELLYGRAPRLINEARQDSMVLEDRFENKSETQILEAANEIRKASQTLAREKRNQEIEAKPVRKTQGCQVNDIVMKRLQGFERENKLDSKWQGPYRVTRVFEWGGVEIENSQGKRFRYNEQDIRPMEGTDPEEWNFDKEGWMLSEKPTEDNRLIIRLAKP